MIKTIQEDVSQIQAGMEQLILFFNDGKRKFQFLSLSKTGRASNLFLLLKGTHLEQVASYRYMGVDVDDSLTFSQHTRRVVTSEKRANGGLSRNLRKWAPRNVYK